MRLQLKQDSSYIFFSWIVGLSGRICPWCNHDDYSSVHATDGSCILWIFNMRSWRRFWTLNLQKMSSLPRLWPTVVTHYHASVILPSSNLSKLQFQFSDQWMHPAVWLQVSRSPLPLWIITFRGGSFPCNLNFLKLIDF